LFLETLERYFVALFLHDMALFEELNLVEKNTRSRKNFEAKLKKLVLFIGDVEQGYLVDYLK
jgi:hypothetical protein